jgi:hypothetical protein
MNLSNVAKFQLRRSLCIGSTYRHCAPKRLVSMNWGQSHFLFPADFTLYNILRYNLQGSSLSDRDLRNLQATHSSSCELQFYLTIALYTRSSDGQLCLSTLQLLWAGSETSTGITPPYSTSYFGISGLLPNCTALQPRRLYRSSKYTV